MSMLGARLAATVLTRDTVAIELPNLRLMPPCSAQQPKDELIGTQNESPAPEDEKPVLSYALNESFAAEELMEELKDKKQFGKRGEVVLLMQIVTCLLVIFPPMKLYGVVYFAGALLHPSTSSSTGIYQDHGAVLCCA
jgi:hypothetical protein